MNYKIKILILTIIFTKLSYSEGNYFETDNYFDNVVNSKNEYYLFGISNSSEPDLDKYFVFEKYNEFYEFVSKDSIVLYSNNKRYFFQDYIEMNDTIFIRGYFWNGFFVSNVTDPRLFSIKIINDELYYAYDTLQSSITNTMLPVVIKNTQNMGISFEENSLFIKKYDNKSQFLENIKLKEIKDTEYIDVYDSYMIEGKYYIIYNIEEFNRNKTFLDIYDENFKLEKKINIFEGRNSFVLSKYHNNNIYILINIITNSSIEMKSKYLFNYDIRIDSIKSVNFGLTSFDNYYDLDFINDNIILSGYKNKLNGSSFLPDYPLLTRISNNEEVKHVFYEDEEYKQNYFINFHSKNENTAILFGKSRIKQNKYFFKEVSTMVSVEKEESSNPNKYYLENSTFKINSNNNKYYIYNYIGQKIYTNSYFNGRELEIDFSNQDSGIYFIYIDNNIYIINYLSL